MVRAPPKIDKKKFKKLLTNRKRFDIINTNKRQGKALKTRKD